MNKPEKINILGVNFNYLTFDEAQAQLLMFLENSAPRAIFTPNPEFVMLARKDKDFTETLNKADLLLPDGIGIVLASRLQKHKLKERVTGYDTALSLLEKIKERGKKVYFYGGRPGVALLAKQKLEAAHGGLNIAGVRDGYINEHEQAEMIEEIKALAPDVLLVGTGSPRQEHWIIRHKDDLPCKIIMGVGGSFDGFSGKVPRAPRFISKMGMEWLYRLICQPSRIKRQIQLPLFLIAVVMEKFRKS